MAIRQQQTLGRDLVEGPTTTAPDMLSNLGPSNSDLLDLMGGTPEAEDTWIRIGDGKMNHTVGGFTGGGSFGGAGNRGRG